MIDLITGVPGSGKTFFVVHQVFDLISKKDKKYKNIFTNINGFNYKLANDIAKVPDYVQPFEFPTLKSHMEQEYQFHQLSKDSTISLKSDFEPLSDNDYCLLNELEKKSYDLKFTEYKKSVTLKALKTNYDAFVKKQGVYDTFSGSLIIVDECHLYFESREDPILIRFLSYHRHFNIDMLIVTQNKNLINKKYLSFVESMYVAYPASKRLFSKVFRYKKYASYQEYHSNIVGTTSLKLEKHVFDLYSSGSNVIGQSVVKKMIFPIVLVVILAFSLFYYLSSKFESNPKSIKRDSNISKSVTMHHQNDVTHQDILSPDLSSTKLYKVDCFSDSCIFYNSSSSFKKTTLLKLIDKYKCKIIINNITDVNYQTYFLSCDPKIQDFLNFFKSSSELKNEKSINSSHSISKSLSF